MNEIPSTSGTSAHLAGRSAAQQIWRKQEGFASIDDPRSLGFSSGVLAGLAEAAAETGQVLREVIENAGASAEGLNIDVFQGIVEVLQNADDLGATEVRIALMDAAEGRQLLIVHDGAPVTCHHVLPMVLPFLTTKSGEADLKGRFGIGLKTLGRIAKAMTIHSAPYHFVADGLNIGEVAAEAPVVGFYRPGVDTLLRLDLVAGFEPEKLEAWFDEWSEDGLLFLRSVQRFVWCDIKTGVERAKAVKPGEWLSLPVHGSSLDSLACRRVTGSAGGWAVFKATVPTTAEIPRSHKATGRTTTLSFALADHEHETGVFVAFRTRLPVSLPFSIDGQFDPSTAREGLIENEWNKWLIARCGDALEEIAAGLLLSEPSHAWPWIPVPGETIGSTIDVWLQSAFDAATARVREGLANTGQIKGEPLAALSGLAFEDAAMEGLLAPEDVGVLAPERIAMPMPPRDVDGRWRRVLSSLNGPFRLGATELAEGFSRGAFSGKPFEWWVDAAARLTELAPNLVHALPCWRSDADKAVACSGKGETDRPLVIGDPLSAFTRRWDLLDRLHDDYARSETGQVCLSWLQTNAEVTSLVDAKVDLAAFAERFAKDPQEISDEDLRDLRDRFDLLSDRAAQALGQQVGAALRLDGYVFKSGKRQDCKVAPTEAYLSKTLEGENAHWPVAAGTLPGISWLASSYDERLKSGATRTSRKRADGVISRGPRKFLLLLGAAIAPRLQRTGQAHGGVGLRRAELSAAYADHVDYDVTSPDLTRVISSLVHTSKKDRKVRGPALIKAISRNWEAYAADQTVPAWKNARVYRHPKGQVTAAWLNQLKETEWMVVGTGELTLAETAVVRSSSTQSMYGSSLWLVAITPDDLRPAFVSTLKLITDVRASDLVGLLEQVRAEGGTPDSFKTLSVYRALAKQPLTGPWHAQRLGDIDLASLRARFARGSLIWVEGPNGEGQWKAPGELLTGRDIFHDPTRFVPGGPSCAELWKALAVMSPSLDDCLVYLKGMGAKPYSTEAEAVLIDVYRFMEGLLQTPDRRQRDRLKALPVGGSTGWESERPILQLDDRELRQQLAQAYKDLRFWNPPCDTQALPLVTAALGLTPMAPKLLVPSSPPAREQGEAMADRFRSCVDHLANELMRNDPATRDALTIPWDVLRELPLQIHENPFEVGVSDPAFGRRDIFVRMGAVLQRDPLRLDITRDALSLRDSGGRAIASMFPRQVRHRVEAEWVASWIASGLARVERLNTASDEDHRKALEEHASTIDISAAGKIKVTKPASRSAKVVAPRRLKTDHSGAVTIEVQQGVAPTSGIASASRPLLTTPPIPSTDYRSPPVSEPVEYTTADLEQRGWEILRSILANAKDGPLSDFRRRHGVGSDGAIGWRTFVELKATARSPQSSVEFSASEFERAQNEGMNFMLALVSGLEEGFETQIRIILDPTRAASVKPLGTVRLSGLQTTHSLVVRWNGTADADGEKTTNCAEGLVSAA